MAKRESGKENKVLFSRKSKPKEPTNKIKKLAAFTLAEVLITLVIIGIVAALTIPSIVVSYRKHETVTRLKKVYSTLAQTTNKAIADYGPIQNWDFNVDDTKSFVDKYLTPYLNVAKNCGYETTDACEFKYANLDTPGVPETFDEKYYKIVLNDGSTLFMIAKKNGVTEWLQVVIDINGQKAPNIYGKDIFRYIYWINNDIYSGTFGPDASSVERSNLLTRQCNKTAKGHGYGCAALIMKDGWQIKNDYPW